MFSGKKKKKPQPQPQPQPEPVQQLPAKEIAAQLTPIKDERIITKSQEEQIEEKTVETAKIPQRQTREIVFGAYAGKTFQDHVVIHLVNTHGQSHKGTGAVGSGGQRDTFPTMRWPEWEQKVLAEMAKNKEILRVYMQGSAVELGFGPRLANLLANYGVGMIWLGYGPRP